MDLSLQKAETGLLVAIFIAMLGVAVFQVVSRNLFDAGFAVGDELVRMAVLWLTMVGSMVAAREKKHIRIDILDRFLPLKAKRHVNQVVDFLTGSICLAIAYYSIDFIKWEMIDQTVGVGIIPAWILELIIPISALVMAIRYYVHIFVDQTSVESE